jgi:hypothetical protein
VGHHVPEQNVIGENTDVSRWKTKNQSIEQEGH